MPYVSQDALARIRAAVEQLNYRPNSIARSLKSRRTSTLGLITNDLEGVFTMSMMRGVEEVASAQITGIDSAMSCCRCCGERSPSHSSYR